VEILGIKKKLKSKFQKKSAQIFKKNCQTFKPIKLKRKENLDYK
jgi:hypothetical protein